MKTKVRNFMKKSSWKSDDENNLKKSQIRKITNKIEGKKASTKIGKNFK